MLTDWWTKLYINGQEQKNFIVSEAHLSEQLSAFGAAEITAFSGETLYDYKGLQDFLNKPASLVLLYPREEEEEEPRIARCFVGKITKVVHCGLCHVEGEEKVYMYRLLLESALSDMRYVRRSRSFFDMTLQDVLNKILEYYEFTPVFKVESPDMEKYDFYQRDETDEIFFRRILRQAGWSFCLKQKKPPEGQEEELIITSGSEYSSDKDQEFKTVVAYCNEDEEYDLALLQWNMSSCIGTDSVETEDKADKVEKGSRMWFMNDTPEALKPSNDTQTLSDFRKKQSEQQKDSFTQAKTEWTGKGIYLPDPIPGCILKVMNFYGKDSEEIKARVSSVECHIRNYWLRRYGKPDAGYKPIFEVLLKANEVTTQAQLPRADICSTAGCGRVYPAVVCLNKDSQRGQDQANTSVEFIAEEKKNGMYFYAFLDGATTPVRVLFTMPLGGAGQGLFRLPRVNDRILVTDAGNGSYLLTAYIPSRESMPFADAAGDQMGGRTVLRHNAVAYAPDYYENGVKDPVPKNYTCDPEKKTKYSEIGMYTMENKEEAVQVLTPGFIYSHADKDYVSTANNFLFSTPDGTGQFHLADVNEVVVQAQRSIRFQVAGNWIELTPQGIELHSRELTNLDSPTDPAITLNPWGTCTASAGNLMLFGQASASLFNGVGGKISMNGAQTTLQGNRVAVGTTDDKENKWFKSFNNDMLSHASDGVNSSSSAAGELKAVYADFVDKGTIDHDLIMKQGNSISDDLRDKLWKKLGPAAAATGFLSYILSDKVVTPTGESDIGNSIIAVLNVTGAINDLEAANSSQAKPTDNISKTWQERADRDAMVFSLISMKYEYLLSELDSASQTAGERSFVKFGGDELNLHSNKLNLDAKEYALAVEKVEKVENLASYTKPADAVNQLPDFLSKMNSQADSTASSFKSSAESTRSSAASKIEISKDKVDLKTKEVKMESEKDFSIKGKNIKEEADSNFDMKGKNGSTDFSKLEDKVQTLEQKCTSVKIDGSTVQVSGDMLTLSGSMISLG